MAVLSIKDFDSELLRLLKSSAALKGETQQEFLENLVANAMGVETPRRADDSATKNPPKTKTRTKDRK